MVPLQTEDPLIRIRQCLATTCVKVMFLLLLPLLLLLLLLMMMMMMMISILIICSFQCTDLVFPRFISTHLTYFWVAFIDPVLQASIQDF